MMHSFDSILKEPYTMCTEDSGLLMSIDMDLQLYEVQWVVDKLRSW